MRPIGRNSLFCSSSFGVCLSDIASMNKSFVWTIHRSQRTASWFSTVSVLLDLLFAKFGYFQGLICAGTVGNAAPILISR